VALIDEEFVSCWLAVTVALKTWSHNFTEPPQNGLRSFTGIVREFDVGEVGDER
jgi:hypothetical protein